MEPELPVARSARAGSASASTARRTASGELDYYLSFRQPADWLSRHGLSPGSPDQVARFLAQELSGWAPLFHEAFSATTSMAFLPMHRVEPMPEREVTQPITLVGDAAHLMPPYAGVGVNIGLMDALNLADNFSSGQFPGVEAAIESHGRAMRAHARQAQEDTAASELALHSDMSPEEPTAATRGPQ